MKKRYTIEQLREEYQDLTADSAAKIILSLKSVAAYIVKGLIEDFKDTPIDEIINEYLKDPKNPNSPYVTLKNTEIHYKNFTLVNFDLHFEITSPKGISYEIEIEVQKNEENYPLEVRATIYTSQLLAQEQWNLKTDYNSVRPAVSVWINMIKSKKYNQPITHTHLITETFSSNYSQTMNSKRTLVNQTENDLFNIFFINLGSILENEETDPMVKNLYDMFNGDITSFNEYLKENNINDENILMEEVEMYTPLTDAFIEEGREKGFIQGKEEGIKEGIEVGKKETKTENRAKIKEIQRNSKDEADFINQILNYFELSND